MNPFRPTFGISPPRLVGRSDLVNLFAAGLDAGPGAPSRATLYTGPRGTGKTVMLNAVEDAARSRGWIVISETAHPGVVHRISTDHLPAALHMLGETGEKTRITGVTAPLGLGGVSLQTTDGNASQPSLRSLLSHTAGLAAKHGTGVLITLDEIHGADQAEVREIATTIQHMFREERNVAFVAAGLPNDVEGQLLQDNIITFLRRADQHRLGLLDEHEVADGISIPISEAGRSIEPAALAKAVRLAAGYPFMVQVVGHSIWERNPQHRAVTVGDVTAATPLAIERVGRLVHTPAMAGLSDRDRQFLAAMTLDSGPSRMGDIAERLGVSPNYASQYRRRLLATELIDSPTRGRVCFALPYLREHIQTLDIDFA